MQVVVTLLGGLSVEPGGPWKSRRAAQLVALLALTPNRRLTTEQVMDALWPDLEPDSARANLHKTATLARQSVGAKDAVVLRSDTVALWPEADILVDAVAFEAAARQALAAAADRSRCAHAAGLYTGELLPEERYEDWAQGPRDRLRALYLDLLRAAGLWAELAEEEPTDEPAHRELMRQHAESGRLHAAIRQFQRFRTVLAREVGVPPSPATVALYHEIVGKAASGLVRPGLVGREVELVRARAALPRAAEGRLAAVFVTGAAGIGKTRVCEELLDHTAGWFVLRAAGREQTASTPYWPLVEAIQAALLDRPDVAEALGDTDRALLARLSGLGTDQSAGVGTPGPDAETGAAPPPVPVNRHAVLHLLSRVVAPTGAARSMLFLDDAQWMDEDTLALAEVLASAPPPRGTVLLAAYRPDDGAQVGAMARAMLGRGAGVEIALHALTRAECDTLVAGVLARPARDGELDLVWELSEGNPFFAVEVAAALGADGAPGASAAGAVDLRLGRLPADAHGAVRAVALVADEFTADEFAALAAVDGDRALDHLDVAISLGVVARRGSSYRFRHDLVRDRLIATVGDADRTAAHAAAADRLAGLGARPARIVHHLLAAGREDAALPWLRRAVAEAMQMGAHADAVAAIERALAIAPHDPSLLAQRADALNGLGDRGAPAAYLVAMAVTPEPERAAVAVRRARALINAGEVPAALEILATLDGVPAHAQGQLHVTRGLACWCTGALDEADEAGRHAQRLAEETCSVRDFVDATMVLAMVAHERGSWPQRVSLDLLDLHVRPDLAHVVMDAHLCVAESYLYGGVPYPEIVVFAEDLRRRAAEAGAPRAEAFATTLLGEAHLLMGDTNAAVGLLRSASEQHRRVGVLCGESLSLQRLAQAHMAEDDVEQAQAALNGALIAARGSPVATRHLLDRIHGTAIRIATDPLAAVDEAEKAVRGGDETCPPCSINRMVPAAIACADAGDLERASAYLAWSEQVAAAFYPRGGWQAVLDEVRAHVALAQGDTDAAGRFSAAALAALEQLGQRLDADRILATAGRV